MGQKINPIGFRLAVNRNWSSRWYASNRNFAPMLAEDLKVRAFLKKKLAHASVGRVLIERPAKDARITIFSARPGVVIGKKGEDIESLKAELRAHPGRAAGARQHRGNQEARDRRAADRRLDRAAAGEAHHVPPRDEARDAERDAPGRAGHQDHERGPPERPSKSRVPSGTAKAACRCIRCAPTSTTAPARRRPATASSASRSGSTRAK